MSILGYLLMVALAVLAAFYLVVGTFGLIIPIALLALAVVPLIVMAWKSRHRAPRPAERT